MPKTSEAPTSVRLSAPVGLASKDGEDIVERDGGKYNAGLIRGFSAITRGEALGHGLWIDDVFLNQVAASDKRGVKSRFTHPGLSSDGLAKALGRALAFRVDGDRVRSDLHIHKSAHSTPEGDYAGYIMARAEEAPEEFGASIVFDLDHGEMHRFTAQHEDDEGSFKSPDAANTNNYPHARLAKLSAVDMVGDPAANEDGLFSRGSALPAAAEVALSHAFGCKTWTPHELDAAGEQLTIHPERLRIFLADFFERQALEVIPKPPQDGAGKDSEMEWADVTATTLSEHCPDVAGALRTEGMEEADKKASTDLETAKGEATVEALKVERERVTEVFSQAKDCRLAADDEAVQKALANGLEGDKLEIALKTRAIEVMQSEAPPPVDPDAPPAAIERPSPSVKGLSAEEAWEKNAIMPNGNAVRAEFAESGKEGFLEFAIKDQEGKKLFG